MLVWTDNSIITGWRHVHQSWMHMAPPSDDTSAINRTHATYDFLCDTAIIEKYRTGRINDKE